MSELTAAKTAMSEAGIIWRDYTNRIRLVRERFTAADSKVKAKLTEYKAKQAIAESKAYTKATSSKEKTAVKNQVAKLEAIQAEYKASHGNKENAALKKEITRLTDLLCWATPILGRTKDKSQGGDVGKTASELGIKPNPNGWCDAYILLLLRKAGRGDIADQLGDTCSSQIKRLKNGHGGTWVPVSDKKYKPKTGDLVYFGASAETSGHVGMFVVKDDGEVWVLHGNYCGAVAFTRWTTPASEQVEPLMYVHGKLERRHDLKAFTVGYGVID